MLQKAATLSGGHPLQARGRASPGQQHTHWGQTILILPGTHSGHRAKGTVTSPELGCRGCWVWRTPDKFKGVGEDPAAVARHQCCLNTPNTLIYSSTADGDPSPCCRAWDLLARADTVGQPPGPNPAGKCPEEKDLELLGNEKLDVTWQYRLAANTSNAGPPT